MHEGVAEESRVREITGDLFEPVTVSSQKPALKVTGQLLGHNPPSGGHFSCEIL
jgi:hypothetical protein